MNKKWENSSACYLQVKKSLNRTCSFHYFAIKEDCYSEDYIEVVTFDGAKLRKRREIRKL